MNEPLKKYDDDFISKLGMAISTVLYIQFAKHECLAFRDGDPPITINLKQSSLQTASKCSNCTTFNDCYPQKRRCWVNVVKAYGVDNWVFLILNAIKLQI